jgi:hypothetical protein
MKYAYMGEELFSLINYNQDLFDYYVDRNRNFYSSKKNKITILNPEYNMLRANGNVWSKRKILNTLERNVVWNEFISGKSAKSGQTSVKPIGVGLGKNTFIVAIVENGVPLFSKNPMIHATEEKAVTEVARLAKEHAGKQFAYFMCMGIAKAAEIVWQ